MRLLPRVAIVTALLFAGSPTGATAQSTETDPPTLTLSAPAATVGQQVNVTGQHFAPMTAMSIQVCGNEARAGSTDCDVVAGQTVLTDEQGIFRSHLSVRFPPVPCPCVVWATSHSGPTTSATAPIGVIAANYTPPPPDEATQAIDVEVVRADVVQDAAWRAWFGLPSSARLRVTVRNPGEGTIARPVLSLNVGRGDDPAGVLDAPPMDALHPGEERTIEVPISLGPLAHGSYTVKGTIGSTPVTFRATTSVFPWGDLLLVVLIMLGATLWWVPRKRRARTEEEPALALPLAPEPEPSNDDLHAVASITLEPEETVTVNLADDDLPQMATDDELVAWGAALINEAHDANWLTDGNYVDLAPCEEVIVVSDTSDDTPVVDVAFALPGYEDALGVVLCGEFNDWSPDATPMQYRSGLWGVIVALESDRDYRYRFLVNGDLWLDDPFTSRRTPNDFGGHDSIIHTRHADNPAHDLQVTAPA